MFLEPEPALASPALDRPDFEILAFTEDAEFAVSVVRDSLRGERTLLTDEFRATAIGDEYLYMRVLGHLPVLFHPDPRRVGVLALGTGTTVGSVSLHPDVERIDVLEISRAVVEFAPYFEEVHLGALDEGLPGLLELEEGERVGLYLGDGRRTLARLPEGSLDVLTMELNMDEPVVGVAVLVRLQGFMVGVAVLVRPWRVAGVTVLVRLHVAIVTESIAKRLTPWTWVFP